MKFGENSFLALQFKESYRREQQREDREGDAVRKRRALPASSEFSIRFRTRNDGLLLLATDSVVTSVSGYTVMEVSFKTLFVFFDINSPLFKRERNRAESTFAKTFGTRDREIIGQYSKKPRIGTQVFSC